MIKQLSRPYFKRATLMCIALIGLTTAAWAGPNQSNQSAQPKHQIVAENLQVPWSMAFLPNQQIIFTERGGRIGLIDPQNQQKPQTLDFLTSVTPIGEGGLLGITLHPHFTDNHWLYVYFTYQDNDQYYNQVRRYRYQNGRLTQAQTIIDHIPAAYIHNGGRLQFGPDGYLYITTGDANQPKSAQDIYSLAGKILRIKADGAIPQDNPFANSPVYSYGHRNPQGLAWDHQNQLWATEHGPIGHDEINRIQKGKNYGWPIIRGQQHHQGMKSPIYQSGDQTWGPSGATFFKGKLYFAGLRGEALYSFNPSLKQLQTHWHHQFGRLRAVTVGPEGNMYLLTSNRDGRARPRKHDDRIIEITLPLSSKN